MLVPVESPGLCLTIWVISFLLLLKKLMKPQLFYLIGHKISIDKNKIKLNTTRNDAKIPLDCKFPFKLLTKLNQARKFMKRNCGSLFHLRTPSTHFASLEINHCFDVKYGRCCKAFRKKLHQV